MSKSEASTKSLYFKGANFAADNVVTRTSLKSSADFEVLLIQRKDNGKWARPGGFVDKGETPEAAALRELKEEAGIELDSIAARIVYRGVVNDPRNTTESWIETTAFHRQLPKACDVIPKAGDDATDVRWTKVNDENLRDLHADHAKFIRLAVKPIDSV